jgi:hypothetical protein
MKKKQKKKHKTRRTMTTSLKLTGQKGMKEILKKAMVGIMMMTTTMTMTKVATTKVNKVRLVRAPREKR